MDEKEAKIKEAVNDYLDRTRGEGGKSSDSELIDCPECGRFRAMEFKGVAANYYLWKCLWKGCRYEIPEEFSPPGPDEVARLIRMKRNMKMVDGL